jgi:hypothetical protein
VRNLPVGSTKWYTPIDDLKGNYAPLNHPVTDATKEWNIIFNERTFTKYLFMFNRLSS